MKRLFFALLACFALTAFADGWIYQNGKASIESGYEYIKGDYDTPTQVFIFVGKLKDGSDCVIAQIAGECDIHDFRDGQEYVIMNFSYNGDEKWVIKQIGLGGQKFNGIIFKKTAQLIKRLKKCEGDFSLSLPLFGVGVRTFYFNVGGYPLDW